MKRKRSKLLAVSPKWLFLGLLYAVTSGGWAAILFAAEGKSGKAQPAQSRELRIVGYVEAEPLFLESANTLNPVATARDAWKGYLTQMADLAGRTADLRPMYRLLFDNRALPWPSLKQNQVDGFDVNTRNFGAHAALHAMLGDEKQSDPAELGQLAYVLTLTPSGPGSMVAHGELAENLLQLHATTGEQRHLDWAELVIRELKPPIDSNDPMGGWLHLHVGWNIGALTRWYAVTGEHNSLELAIACAERVSKSRDADGDDGAFRPDGSFGGKSQSTTASWHMHGHTHILPGFILLGEQLLQDGRTEQGLTMIARAERTFDWLYDADRNPDAGSLTGWLGEWLMVATGWDRQSDCEGCTMGDMVEAAVALGAVSRSHPSLGHLATYYDRAEQIYRGQVEASIFQPSPAYLRCVRSCLEEHVAKRPLGSIVWRDRSGRGNDAELVAGNVKMAPINANDPASPPTVALTSAGRFQPKNSAALRLPQFAIFAVLRATADEAQSIYSNYDNPINWGKGVNFGLSSDGCVSFFTTDGTEQHYDPLTSSAPLDDGWHLVAATYDGRAKHIYIDGDEVAASPAKGIDYGLGSVAAVGALREFGQQFQGELAELLVTEAADERDRKLIERYLAHKFSLAIAASAASDKDFVPPALWLKADDGLERERPEPTAAERAAEVDRLYDEALITANRMEGRLLGLCGFGDWINKLPATLDPALPGVDMMGCCSDAVIRAAYAIWSETVTGDAKEARVNLAFNRQSPLVDVVSCLPHRGELDIRVQNARRVLVRIPEWTPRDTVRLFIDRAPTTIQWQDSYVVFPHTKSGQLLTVTYPLRIAEIKETVGSLDGTRYTERWRGNTIVEIAPRGKWFPTFVRPELETTAVTPLPLAAAPANRQQEAPKVLPKTKTVSADDAHLLFAPYVWKRSGAGTVARAEATIPGGYLRATFTGTKHLALLIDGTFNAGCPPESRPVLEYSLDHGEFTILHLNDTSGVYELPLADDLDPAAPHQLEIILRAADLTAQRWTSPKTHLAIAGLRGDAGLELRDTPHRLHNAIAYGDSITEGVGGDGLFTSWQKLDVNNARATWFPLVASALDCEYGQLGSGGHGIARSLELPPLAQAWDHYDANNSRLVDGRLAPEPDYVFCALGTNDFDLDIRAPYRDWLAAARSTCPTASFFCIVPPLGVHREEIAAAVADRHAAGDSRVHLIDTRPLQDSFTPQRPTALAYDGVHPTVYGQALLATHIVSEIQKILAAEPARQDPSESATSAD